MIAARMANIVTPQAKGRLADPVPGEPDGT
jgi:hypothetical protein